MPGFPLGGGVGVGIGAGSIVIGDIVKVFPLVFLFPKPLYLKILGTSRLWAKK